MRHAEFSAVRAVLEGTGVTFNVETTGKSHERVTLRVGDRSRVIWKSRPHGNCSHATKRFLKDVRRTAASLLENQ